MKIHSNYAINDAPAEDHTVTRDGDLDLTFRGWQLGSGSTGSGGTSGYSCDWDRGVDVTVYLTAGGSLLATVETWSRWQGEGGSDRVLGPVSEPAELLDLLRDDSGGQLGPASKEAWEAACAACDLLTASQSERIA